MVLGLPTDLPAGGGALHREWVADWAEIFCSNNKLDALLVSATEPAELAGLLMAALRLDLPAVVVPATDSFGIALAALGLAPLAGDAAQIAVELAKTGCPGSGELVGGFSLANALRAGLAAGGGPELLVHLAAIAREAGVLGFSQMIRVLVPESAAVTGTNSPWFEDHGAAGLFAYLDDALHDTPTVTGRLKESLPPAPPAPEAVGSRLVFVRGRASGTEAICWADRGVAEVAGDCRFYTSEDAAVEAVEKGAVGPSDLLVVAGCGPRGGPGLLRLDRLGAALEEAGLSGIVPVLTDGLPPEGVSGAWASLATPEAAASGVIGCLQDGDPLRLDLTEGLIRTDVAAEEIQQREPFVIPASPGFGYAARYARAALPALEGAGAG
ncbi:MAG: dihydroxy-acid dehydratase [Rubrobacteraceae bacterium]|nr:dihydroxy-acid dehydratase [Rubrobacteraceae bacterium]